MATWKKVIVSGSNAELNQITASGGFSGDGSGLTGISADSLGNSLVDGNGIADFTFDGGSSGVVVALDLNGSTLNLGSSGVKVADAGITETQLHTSVAGAGLAGGGGTVLSVGVDGSTVEISSDAVRVKDAGITMAKLANVATDTFIGRTASGNGVPKALSKAEALAILNVADGANANVSGNSGNAAIYDNGGTPAFKSGITKAEVLTLINVSDGATTDQDLSGLALKTSISGAFTAGEGIDISSGVISGEDASATNKGIAKFNTANFANSSGDITIKDGGVALAEMANLAADKIIGRANGAGTGVPTALTATQVRTIINVENGATADQDLSSYALIASISGAFTAGEGIDISSGVIAGEDASVTNKGIASFDTNHFAVSNGAVTVKAGSIQTGDIENDAVTGTQLANDITIANDLTVTGDLLVSGDTVTVNTANLNVEDQFILINSGSSTATNESGIIFGGSNGAVGAGAALIWNGDYNSNDGRLAVANAVNWNATSATVSYSVAGVFEGSVADAATALADHAGNIRIESDEIFIYV